MCFYFFGKWNSSDSKKILGNAMYSPKTLPISKLKNCPDSCLCKNIQS